MARPLSQYAAWTLDTPLREMSTSGGVFTELARTVFRDGGVVVAAGWLKSPFRVAHKVASQESDLDEMRGAKYAPSDMSDAWKDVNNALSKGRYCLFVGTPCQTAAIRKRFGSGNGKLLVCALFCHSVPERYIWAKYVNELELAHGSPLKSVQFRCKKHGGTWRNGIFVADFEDGQSPIIEPLAGNVYCDAFFMRLSTRRSCLNCRFKCGNSGADIMIGDFWGVEKSHPELDDGKGLSAVLVYTSAGDRVLAETKCELRTVEYQEIVACNKHLEHSVACNTASRARFFRLCNTMTIEEALNKIRTRSMLGRIVSKVRMFIRRGIK